MANFAAAQTGEAQAIGTLAAEINQSNQYTNTPVTGATVTLTAAQVINGIVTISTGSTCAVTMPTAATVVAALKNCQVGTGFDFVIQNQNSGTATMNGAVAGNTYTGNTVNPLTHTTLLYKGVVTNATVGSEAVTYFALMFAGS